MKTTIAATLPQWRLVIDLEEAGVSRSVYLEYDDRHQAEVQCRRLRRLDEGPRLYSFRNERGDSLAIRATAYQGHQILGALEPE